MKNLGLYLVGLTLLTGFSFNGSAQPEIPLKLTIGDLYKNNLFNQKGIQSLRWMEDGRQYSFPEGNTLYGGKDLIACDAVTAQKKVLVPAGKLIPPGSKTPVIISDYSWSTDNQKLYDNIYQERYINLPENNEEGFRDGSPVTHARNLKGNLLLIHGSFADDHAELFKTKSA